MNLLLAQSNPVDKLLVPSARISPEVIYLLIALGVILLGLIVWALFIRKSKDDLSGWGPSHSHYTPPSGNAVEHSGSHKHRRRRRRREHRPRNPTLAETGGLPPTRAEEPADSGQ